jgi:hypothetical protein
VPVPSSHESFLLHDLQSGHPFRWNKTAKSLRGILHEGFHPARDASCFPEGRHRRFIDNGQKMFTDAVTGSGEAWPVPFVVAFQVADGLPIAKRVIHACQNNDCVPYLYSVLFCHDASSPFA